MSQAAGVSGAVRTAIVKAPVGALRQVERGQFGDGELAAEPTAQGRQQLVDDPLGGVAVAPGRTRAGGADPPARVRSAPRTDGSPATLLARSGGAVSVGVGVAVAVAVGLEPARRMMIWSSSIATSTGRWPAQYSA